MNIPDQITIRPIDDLIPYARNARTHTPGQIAAIAGSMREFGWTNPVLIDAKGGIVAGHGRVLAARQLGLTDIPCIELAHLTDTQRRAYILADNQLAINGSGWDMELLKLELTELKALDFDLDLTGFDADELAGIDLSGEDATEGDTGEAQQTMSERFGIPPFSVLNAREGWWQARKQAWIALGIQSELGRGENLTNPPGATDGGGGLLIDGYRRQAGGVDMDQQRNQRERIELLPQPNATPGGSLMPAMNYRNKQRGDGKGRPIADTAP